MFGKLYKFKGVSNMADISMCTNEECKKKNTCYRFKARASDYLNDR